MRQPHDDRLNCPVADACGGCAWIGSAYGEQLRRKRERVVEALARFGDLEPIEIEPCLPAPRRAGYRNRAKLAVARTRDGLRVGLFRRGTNEIVDLAPCRVQGSVVQAGLQQVRGWLERHALARPDGPVFYVDVREAWGGRCHVTLVLSRSEALPLEELRERWSSLQGIAINLGDPHSSYPMGPQSEIAHGPPTFPAPLPREFTQDLRFEVPPGGFFQVAPAVLEKAHEKMAEHLGNRGPLLDLYCGVGVHGLVLQSASGEELLGIDESTASIEAARLNARRMGIPARYSAGRVERLLTEHAGELPSRIVLNPGRSGCRAEVIERLARAPGARLVYLSCNPTNLARDLARFVRRAGSVVRVVPIDLMPQTDHVEALACMLGPTESLMPAAGGST